MADLFAQAPSAAGSTRTVKVWQVGRCTVDLSRQLVTSPGGAVELRPKAWQLLCCLLEHPCAVVRSADLLHALWPRQQVLPKVLVNVVSELRVQLGDATVLRSVPRRGYVLHAEPLRPQTPVVWASAVDALRPAAKGPFVGRHRELHLWHTLASQVPAPARRVLGVHGRAGVGKTSFLREGVAQLQARGWLQLWGQSVETSGVSEPYAAVLQALQGWARQGDAGALNTLERCAPSWLAMLPGLLDVGRATGLRAELAQAGPSRMSREIVALLQRMTADAPVVWIIEDLHWADAATVDLLMAALPAVSELPLLVGLSWRSTELPAGLMALLARLQATPLSEAAEVRELQCFNEAELLDYVSYRMPSLQLSGSAGTELARLTGGLPLFLKLLCDDGQVHVAQPEAQPAEPSVTDLTRNLRHQVHQRVARLPPELRSLMERASCITAPVPLPLLAELLSADEDTTLQRCRNLVDLGLFEMGPVDHVWPEARLVPTFGPSHALYRQAVVDRLDPEVSRVIHRRIAMALRSVAEIPGSTLGAHLAQAYIGAGMHVEASQVLQDSGMRWLRTLARRPALEALVAALDQLADADGSQAAVVDLRVLVCTRIIQVQPFDFRSNNELHLRACSQLLDDLSGGHAADQRYRHAACACILHLCQGRSDLALADARALLDAAGQLGPTEQSTAQTCRAFVANRRGLIPEAIQAMQAALSLLEPHRESPEWSPWITALQSMLASWQGLSGQLAAFTTHLTRFVAPGLRLQKPGLAPPGCADLADALVRFGCQEGAVLLYRTALESERESGSSLGCDDAWLGLVACEPAQHRALQVLRNFVATISARGVSRGDHEARLLIVDTLLSQSLWDEAGAELDAAAHIASQWPVKRTELMRLGGRLANGRQLTATAHRLWQEALDIDLENRNLAGALRCVDLLGNDHNLYQRALRLCSDTFPAWLEADLEGEVFAPLAAVQHRHRSELGQEAGR